VVLLFRATLTECPPNKVTACAVSCESECYRGLGARQNLWLST